MLDEILNTVVSSSDNLSEYVKKLLSVMEYDTPYTANAILDLLREIIADLDAIELSSNNQLEVDIKKLKNIYVKL